MFPLYYSATPHLTPHLRPLYSLSQYWPFVLRKLMTSSTRLDWAPSCENCQGSFAKIMNCWIPSFLCWSSLWWEERLIFLIEDWAVESPRVKPDRWVSREEASPNQGKTKWSEWSALAFTIRNCCHNCRTGFTQRIIALAQSQFFIWVLGGWGHVVLPVLGSGGGTLPLQRNHFMPVGHSWAGGDQGNCIKCARIVMMISVKSARLHALWWWWCWLGRGIP